MDCGALGGAMVLATGCLTLPPFFLKLKEVRQFWLQNSFMTPFASGDRMTSWGRSINLETGEMGEIRTGVSKYHRHLQESPRSDLPPPAEGTEALRGQWSPTIREFLWHCGGLCTEVALDFFIVGHFDWRGIKKILSQSIFTSHFHFLNDKKDIFNNFIFIHFQLISSQRVAKQIQTVSSKLIFDFFSTHKWQKKTDCGFSS